MYQERSVDLIVSRSGIFNLIQGTMPEGVAKRVREIDGVAEVAPGLLDMISIEEKNIPGVMVQGWPADSFMYGEIQASLVDPPPRGDKDPRAGDSPLKKGLALAEEMKAHRGVLIEKTLADELGTKAGGKVTLYGSEEFQVVGVFETDVNLEKNNIFMLLPEVQKLTSRPGLITGCTVRLRKDVSMDEARCKEISRKIEEDIAAEFHLTKKLQAKPPSEYNVKQLRIAIIMAWLTSAVACGMGGIFMLNTMIMSVFERTREIGILRAIGWRSGRIMRMILMESFLLSVAGFILGASGAVALTFFLSRWPPTRAIGGTTSLTILAIGLGVAIFVGFIGAIYPAYRGSRLMPTEAIRHE